MAVRLIEVLIPQKETPKIDPLLTEKDIIQSWTQKVSDSLALVRLLIPEEITEKIMDRLQRVFHKTEPFRVLLLPIEAVLPRVSEEEEAATQAKIIKGPQTKSRISREELYGDLEPTTHLSSLYFTMVALSAIVAAIGLYHDNEIILIAAMVIAPLLGPNMALALATTLGDVSFGIRAFKANFFGVGAALLISVLMGIFFTLDPGLSLVQSMNPIGPGGIVLALVSGAAGALAFSTGASSSLIGVMVAVALLPPVVTVGMLVGAGKWQEALGPIWLLFTNIICVNLAAVLIFLIQGVRPMTWWEAKKAKRATLIAISIWIILLMILVLIFFLLRSPKI